MPRFQYSVLTSSFYCTNGAQVSLQYTFAQKYLRRLSILYDTKETHLNYDTIYNMQRNNMCSKTDG